MYKTTEEKKVDEFENPKKTINILLIEDNQADARLVTEYLKENENYDFNITYVDCLAKALLIVKDEKVTIDAAILDLRLPDCTGLETFRRLWVEQDRMLPIIVLTGSILSRSDLRYCIEEAHEFLVKNCIDSNTLVQAILSGIERQKARKRITML